MNFKVVQPLEATGESEKYIEIFKELRIEFLHEQCTNEDSFIALAGDADAVITVASLQPVSRRVIENMEKGKLISNSQIGYDDIDIEAATEHGILVTNVPAYCVEEVSDHAMALILACSRRIVHLDEASKRGQWGLASNGIEIQTQIWPKLSRLKGQTLGIFGFGKIANALISKAKGFGLRIIAYDPFVGEAPMEQLGVEKVNWEQFLKESDFISIHAALTPETDHIFEEDAFKKMKPSACLINTSRGGIVDNKSLRQALKTGQIAMAGLDVIDQEPPKASDPLLGLNNIVITAHSAFFSPSSETERWQKPVEEVIRVKKGEWPKEIVNPAAKEKYIRKWGSMK